MIWHQQNRWTRAAGATNCGLRISNCGLVEFAPPRQLRRYALSTPNLSRPIFTLTVGLFPNAVLACSGPGVGALVDANIRLSFQLFAVAAFLFAGTTVLFLFRRKRASLV